MELIREGKNVKEILDQVISEFGWKRDEIQVEIVKEEAATWFHPKHFVVKMKHENKKEDRSIQSWRTNECKDWLFFSDDSLVIVPHFETNAIQIHPAPTLRMWISDSPLFVTTAYTNNLQITYKSPKLDELLKLQVSDDQFNVTVTIDKNKSIRLFPRAILESDILHIYFDERIEPDPNWDIEDVEIFLNNHKISKGIMKDRIFSLLTDPTKWDEGVVVAEGVKPMNGNDTQFILPERLCRTKRSHINESTTTIDHYDFKELLTVSSGETICEIIPHTLGILGNDVFGNEIPAANGTELQLIPNEFLSISNDGKFVTSTCDGLFEFQFPHMKVSPTFVVQGDVDLKSGSIKFSGSVVIEGNVREGMRVEAKDHIFIKGSVAEAVICAGKSIKIQGNCIMSKVIAGKNNEDTMNIWYWIRLLLQEMDRSIEKSSTSKTMNEERLTFLDNWLKMAKDKWFADQTNPYIVRLVRWRDAARLIFTGKSSPTAHENWLVQEGVALEEVLLNCMTDTHGVELYNAHLSTIYASADVQITGKGAYVCTILSNGNVIAIQGEGYIRGGFLLAKHSIQAKTIGSPSGTLTPCIVADQDGHIDTTLGHPGIQSIIGKNRKFLNDGVKYARISYHPSLNCILATALSK